MSQNLPINGFKWLEETYLFYQNFIERYKSKSDERYFLDVDVQYPERLYELHNELPFLSERMKIEKVEKLVVDLYDRK